MDVDGFRLETETCEREIEKVGENTSRPKFQMDLRSSAGFTQVESEKDHISHAFVKRSPVVLFLRSPKEPTKHIVWATLCHRV